MGLMGPPTQGKIDVAPCMLPQLGGNYVKETVGDVVEKTSVFSFGAHNPDSGRASSPAAMVKRRKNKKFSGKEGQGESVSHKVGKRKTEQNNGEISSFGGKRNRKATNEVESQDDISAEAGEQPRRAQ
jgi:hypothetical protein